MSVNLVHYVNLGKDDNNPWKDEAMGIGVPEYSQPIRVRRSTGYSALVVELTGASDDMDISYELSLNGYTWYSTIVDSDGTAMNVVYEALGQAVTWIQYDPPLSAWIRFKFDPDANSTVGFATYIQQEQ